MSTKPHLASLGLGPQGHGDEPLSANNETSPLEGDTSSGSPDVYLLAASGEPSLSTDHTEVEPEDEEEIGGTTTEEDSANPVLAYLESVISQLTKGFASFDGSSNCLRSYAGATAQQSTPQNVPVGVEEFTMPWFGVANSLGSCIVRDESVKRSRLIDLQPLPISTKEARAYFATGLNSILDDATRVGGYNSYYRRSFAYLYELEKISKKFMEAWLAQPVAGFADECAPISNLEALETILVADIDRWVASFFPIFQHVNRSGGELLTPIWADPTAPRIDMVELNFFVSSLCSLKNLLVNSSGYPQGVLVPKKWLNEFVAWMQAAQVKDSAAPPGPIDTLSCVEPSPSNPSKHWLSAQRRTEVDVIPDRLWDFLSVLFGSGPKYTLYGEFTMRDTVMRAVRSTPLRVEMAFIRPEAGGVGTRSTTCYVEDAIHRTSVRELLRLALSLVCEDSDAMSPEDVGFWSSAVYGEDGVRLIAKELLDKYLSPPRELLELGNKCTGDIIKEMEEALGDQLPRNHTEKIISLTIEVHVKEESAQKIVESAQRRGVCGLTNIGNTCFMNSALQCLSNLRLLREHLLALPVSLHPHCVITDAFVRLMSDIWSGQLSYAETRDLKDALGHKVKRFAGYQQQDASEFIEVLLDRMQEEINLVSGRRYRERLDTDKAIPIQELSTIFWENFLVNNTSFIPKDLFHQSKTHFICQTCGESSTVFDNNLTLSLNIVAKPPAIEYRSVKVAVTIDTRHHAAAEAANPKEDLITAYLTAVVPISLEENEMTDADLTTSIQTALAGSEEIRTAVLNTQSNSQIEEGRRIEYAVCLLEVPKLPGKMVIAWATCNYHASAAESTETEEELPEANSFIPAPLPPPAGLGYRVWYFLAKGNTQRIDQSLLVGLEELRMPTLLPIDDVDTVIEAHTAPLTHSILSCGSVLARSITGPQNDLLKGEEEEEDDDEEKENGTHSAAAAEPSSTDSSEDEASLLTNGDAAKKQKISKKTPFTVKYKALLHRGVRQPQFLDIGEQVSDDWLSECRRLMRKGSTTAANPPWTNVAVFITPTGGASMSNGYEHELISTVYDPSYGQPQQRNHSRYFDEQSCTLQECLEHSAEPDIITDADSWYCPRCKEFRETRVQRSIFRLPPCLIISFKRFKMCNSYHAEKNDGLVKFPLDLDFGSFIDPEAVSLNPNTRYKLRGVVYHSGSLSFGHYTAAGFNDTLKKWVHFNDSHASVQDEVSPSPNGAYIVCYERVDDDGEGSD